MTAAALEELALETQILELARYAWGSVERISSLGLAGWLGGRLAVPRLEAMPTMAACVAYNLARRQVVTFTAGDAALAAAASSAIEGRLSPVRIHGQLHVDADWHQPMPVRVARALGARRVLAVDASAHLDRAPAGSERFRESDQRKKTLVEADASHADLVLKPDFGYWVSLSREFRERAIGAGYRDAMARADALRALHGPGASA
jgi:NTE family protein